MSNEHARSRSLLYSMAGTDFRPMTAPKDGRIIYRDYADTSRPSAAD